MWHDMHWQGWNFHMFGWWGIIVTCLLIAMIALLVMRSGEGRQGTGR